MNTLPPYMKANDKVILFDGVCKLCHAWSHFILKFDRKKIFKLASVQSTQGRTLLDYFNYPTDDYQTMLVIDGNQCLEQSDAFFHVMKMLGYPWKLILIFKLIPKAARDWLYLKIASNRYRWFGKKTTCTLPDSTEKGRFLDGF